jgi:predicted TIM-barrel fold metal-dependent hydrolase
VRTLITTDSHLGIPPWLADELPEQYRSLLPHLETRGDERYLIKPRPKAADEYKMEAANASLDETQRRLIEEAFASEVPVESDEQLARMLSGAVGVPARATFGVRGRLKDMEQEGVVASVLISGDFGIPPDGMPLDIEIAWCQLQNDWLAQTYGDEFHRFAAGIHLPLSSVPASVAELERAAAMGMRPVLLPDGIRNRPYWMPEWEPLWEAIDGLRVPVTLHISSYRQPVDWLDSFATPTGPIVSFYDLSCLMGETLGFLALGGIFQRYPNLKVVATEGYAFWLAGLMQFVDHHFEQQMTSQGRYGALGRAASQLEMPPSFYLKRQGRATFMWDPMAIRHRDLTGIDCLMWGNDYPHQEGSFPSSQEWVEKQFAGVPEAEIQQMVFQNAVDTFGFELEP